MLSRPVSSHSGERGQITLHRNDSSVIGGGGGGGMCRVAAAAGDAALGRAAEPDRLPDLRDRLLRAAARAAAGGRCLLRRPPHARQPRPEGECRRCSGHATNYLRRLCGMPHTLSCCSAYTVRPKNGIFVQTRAAVRSGVCTRYVKNRCGIHCNSVYWSRCTATATGHSTASTTHLWPPWVLRWTGTFHRCCRHAVYLQISQAAVVPHRWDAHSPVLISCLMRHCARSHVQTPCRLWPCPFMLIAEYQQCAGQWRVSAPI